MTLTRITTAASVQPIVSNIPKSRQSVTTMEVDTLIRSRLKEIISSQFIPCTSIPNISFQKLDLSTLVRLVKCNHAQLVLKYLHCLKLQKPPIVFSENEADSYTRALLRETHASSVQIDKKMYFGVLWWLFEGLSNASVIDVLGELVRVTELYSPSTISLRQTKAHMAERLVKNPKMNNTMRQACAAQLASLVPSMSNTSGDTLIELSNQLLDNWKPEDWSADQDTCCIAKVRGQLLQKHITQKKFKQAWKLLQAIYGQVPQEVEQQEIAHFWAPLSMFVYSGSYLLAGAFLSEGQFGNAHVVSTLFNEGNGFWSDVAKRHANLEEVVKAIEFDEDHESILSGLTTQGFPVWQYHPLADDRDAELAVYKEYFAIFEACRRNEKNVDSLYKSLPAIVGDNLFYTWSAILMNEGELDLALEFIKKILPVHDCLNLAIDLREQVQQEAANQGTGIEVLPLEVLELILLRFPLNDLAVSCVSREWNELYNNCRQLKDRRANQRGLIESMNQLITSSLSYYELYQSLPPDTDPTRHDCVNDFIRIFRTLLLAGHYIKARDLFDAIELTNRERGDSDFRQAIIDAADHCRDPLRLDWLLGWAIDLSVGHNGTNKYDWVLDTKKNWPGSPQKTISRSPELEIPELCDEERSRLQEFINLSKPLTHSDAQNKNELEEKQKVINQRKDAIKKYAVEKGLSHNWAKKLMHAGHSDLAIDLVYWVEDEVNTEINRLELILTLKALYRLSFLPKPIKTGTGYIAAYRASSINGDVGFFA